MAFDISLIDSRINEEILYKPLGLLYDYARAYNNLPTPDEIKREYPNACGWYSGMEDSALNGGIYLDALIRRLRLENNEQIADTARSIYRGIMRLATVSDSKGFLCRSVHTDGKSHYPNSSRDQYICVISALVHWLKSDLASKAEKQECVEVLASFADRIVDHGFDIPREDGAEAIASTLHELDPDQYPILLAVLKVAAVLTGDRRYESLYLEKCLESDSWRLKHDYITEASVVCSWSIVQKQIATALLCELETDRDLSRTFLRQSKVIARVGMGEVEVVKGAARVEMGEVPGLKFEGIQAADQFDNDLLPKQGVVRPDWRESVYEGTSRVLTEAEKIEWNLFEHVPDFVVRKVLESAVTVLLCPSAEEREEARPRIARFLDTVDFRRLDTSNNFANATYVDVLLRESRM